VTLHSSAWGRTRLFAQEIWFPWAIEVGIEDRIASHTLRKTWVRLQRDVFGTELQTLCYALGHSSERQTLAYCGITPDDVATAYRNVI
jgi:hypothetical protein